ncbi:MAG: transketolase, partial [Pseudomonadota bacterium]
DNLIAVVDFNDQQADGHSTGVMSAEPVAPKFEAFGWMTQRVDGNDIGAVRAAFDAARAADHPGPRAIICDTTMCKGVPFLEAREITHFVRVEPEEWAKALAYLDAEAPT